MKNQTPINETMLESQQSLVGRLQDSVDAMSEIRSLTQQMGTFIVRSRIQETKRSAAATTAQEGSRKRRRVEATKYESSAVVGDDAQSEREESARRMFALYRQLQQTQALFQREIEQFMEETEETCRKAAVAPVSIVAE